jgi:hypothetical protein
MDHRDSRDPIWSLTPSQLAAQCRLIAEGNFTGADKTLQEEARRLYAVWQDALEKPGDDDDVRERKAVLQAGLRKRTIEILVKVSGPS